MPPPYFLKTPLRSSQDPLKTVSRPSQEPLLKNLYAKLIAWIWQRIMCFCLKDLQDCNASTDLQWSAKNLGCFVNINNFEFLCRKLMFFHVGIVPNFLFLIKSARRFRKTISTLASQRVVCVDFQDQRQKTFKWERLNDVESNVQLKSLEYENYDKQWNSDCPDPFVPTEPCHGQQSV